MAYEIDFSIATSEQIEDALRQRLVNIRLTRNLTQEQLADQAGISRMTISKLERGQKSSLDTFIRVLMALGLQDNLRILLPDPNIRPTERVRPAGKERERARPAQFPHAGEPWTWGDEQKEGQ